MSFPLVDGDLPHRAAVLSGNRPFMAEGDSPWTMLEDLKISSGILPAVPVSNGGECAGMESVRGGREAAA